MVFKLSGILFANMTDDQSVSLLGILRFGGVPIAMRNASRVPLISWLVAFDGSSIIRINYPQSESDTDWQRCNVSRTVCKGFLDKNPPEKWGKSDIQAYYRRQSFAVYYSLAIIVIQCLKVLPIDAGRIAMLSSALSRVPNSWILRTFIFMPRWI